MMTQKIQDALNQQIHAELGASYTYLAMSAWLDHEHWKGAAQWMRAQSQEEYGHAMRLYDFVLARGGQIALGAIEAPKVKFKTIVDVFEAAYAHEMKVSKQIDGLYELAAKERVYAAMVQLEWFISEQVEEEKTAREIVARMKMVADDPASLLEIDRELGARTPGGGGEAAVE